MRREIFRMERVTYKEAEVTRLEDFNLQIYEGEIMGMVPFNGYGMSDFLELLQTNIPIYDGYIYYMVNWLIPGKNLRECTIVLGLSRLRVLLWRQ